MKNKIAITTESAVDLSKDFQKKYNIHVIPMNVIIGDEEFKDGVDLDTKQLYEKSELYGALAKTSGVSPHEYKLIFETLTSQGFDVVHIALSSKISSCFQNAQFAANGFDNVFVVDSLSLSAGMALLAIEADKLRNMDKPASEIAHALEVLRTKISTSFILENTEYLYKGGRCSPIQNLGANLFSLRPSIDVVGGKLMPGKKYKGNPSQARIKYIDDKLKENPVINGDTCMLNYSDIDESEVNEIVAHLKETSPFKEVIVNEAGCCISAHCGKGTMGIIFQSGN
ncbi:MAG: DegV family protein [Faecalibacterium sp.]|nr:DegV family protein [Ruminococcus sp.]MCM1391285.1 DegV family protein [Ruminococcus sp.]MCM1484741.1 DegV family protein [Faecalibacterium sp.]